jgi:Ca2+:H+ antiporter
LTFAGFSGCENRPVHPGDEDRVPGAARRRFRKAARLCRAAGRAEGATRLTRVARKFLWASLALAPATILVDLLAHPGKTAMFVLAAAALVPLAWLIGESTEHAAEHTGPGVGGFLNASFGNAPELIIALVAISDGLPNVVRGSLTGSIVSNVLLVLGVAVAVGGDAKIDRRSLVGQVALVTVAAVLFLVPAVPSFHGNPERHGLLVFSIPVAAALLLVYLVTTLRGLRRHRYAHAASAHEPDPGGWTLTVALSLLGIATVATAFVSEILVHSLDAFAHAAGLSQFFISAVIVAIVGNAAEHGGAIVIARRGKMRLATEIAISSSAQVGLLVVPAVMLLSLLFAHPLPLSFRPVEVAAIGGAAVCAWLAVADGRSRRWQGFVLIALYVGAAVGFLAAGDR